MERKGFVDKQAITTMWKLEGTSVVIFEREIAKEEV
jgi:hypothetical protein